MNFRHLHLISFLLAIGFITFYDVKCCRRLPWPPRLIYTGMVFGLLDLASGFNEELSAVTSMGFVLAVFFIARKSAPNCKQQYKGTGQVQTTAFTVANSSYNPGLSATPTGGQQPYGTTLV